MALMTLDRAYKVDEAINTREKHIVIVRFGRESQDRKDKDGRVIPDTKDKKNNDIIEQVDKWLETELATKGSGGLKIYKVEMKVVPELVARFKLQDPVTVLFFFDNVQVDRLQGEAISQDDINRALQSLNKRNTKQPQLSNNTATTDLPIQRTVSSDDTAITSAASTRRSSTRFSWWF